MQGERKKRSVGGKWKKCLLRPSLYAFLSLSLPCVLFAQVEYVPLSPQLPLLNNSVWGDFNSLLNAFVGISVAVAAVLAVIMVAIGGFKYMTKDSVFAISGAKEQITDAVVGLLIVLAAVLIMKTINPKLVELKIFELPNTPNPNAQPGDPDFVGPLPPPPTTNCGPNLDLCNS